MDVKTKELKEYFNSYNKENNTKDKRIFFKKTKQSWKEITTVAQVEDFLETNIQNFHDKYKEVRNSDILSRILREFKEKLIVAFFNLKSDKDEKTKITELFRINSELMQIREVSILLAFTDYEEYPIYLHGGFNPFRKEFTNDKLFIIPKNLDAKVNSYTEFKNVMSEIKKSLALEGLKIDYITVEDMYMKKYKPVVSDKSEKSKKEDAKKEARMENSFKKYFEGKGFVFDDKTIFSFYFALKTKGFVILSGLSGTGKTKIAELFIDLLHGKDASEYKAFIPVRPNFRDSKSLFGFYNPIKEKYHSTELLELILRAKENYEGLKENHKPHFIILDEMNLSHVEYYFAEFLSVIESGRDEHGFTKEGIPLHNEDELELKVNLPPSNLKLPPNIYLIGTVNTDETTYQFSPKVLDRAFTIEFSDVDLSKYPPNMEEEIEISAEQRRNLINDFTCESKFLTRYADKVLITKAVKSLYESKEIKSGDENWLIKINEKLTSYQLNFGYRTVDEIALFLHNTKISTKLSSFFVSLNQMEKFDLATKMKILPKFSGNRQKLWEPLKEMYNLFNNKQPIDDTNYNRVESLKSLDPQSMKETSKKIISMTRSLILKGNASFN